MSGRRAIVVMWLLKEKERGERKFTGRVIRQGRVSRLWYIYAHSMLSAPNTGCGDSLGDNY